MSSRNPVWGLAIATCAIAGYGCATRSQAATSAPSSRSLAQTHPQRVTNRRGNKMGRVIIAMYHHFKPGRGQMFRTPAQFRADLEQYYKLGFRPVLASEYIENKMPLPPGASPIVITFDDSNPTQLQITKDGAVTPKCAVGIWMDFAKTHPDFPVHGTFFAIPDHFWGKKKEVKQKLKILKDLGSEVGNHTITHPFLNRLSDKRVEWELGRCTERLAELGIKPPDVMAVPYGVMPRNKRLLKGFFFHGKRVTFEGVFLAAGPPARSPEDPKFRRLSIPRIVAASGEDCVQTYLRLVAKGKIHLYVQP